MKRVVFSRRFYVMTGTLVAAAAVAALAVAVMFGRVERSGAGRDAPPRSVNLPSGGEPERYAATVTRRFEGAARSETLVTRYARRGDWTRNEWTELGRRYASISRPDLGSSYVVDLDANEYVERTLAEPGPPDALEADEVESLVPATPEAAVTRERAGTETVAGHSCVVFRSRIESPLGGVTESTVWEATDLGGLVLKSEIRDSGGGHATTELTDLDLDPDPERFSVPADARRVEALARP